MDQKEIYIEEAIKAANDLGELLKIESHKVMKQIYQSAAAFGVALGGILPPTNDPHGWNETWERQVKKLTRRERYLRRYKRRGQLLKRKN